MMRSDEPITELIADLKSDDAEAAERLWRLYAHRVAGLARKTLGDAPRAADDEEDVAQSAFRSFFLRARDDRFPRLEDRQDLWKLLGTITVRKALLRLRKDGRRPPTLEEVEVVCGQPDHEWLIALREEMQQLMDRLAEDTLRVAQLALEGHTNQEIAERCGFSRAKVERKRRLIREVWGREAAAEE